jgi:hypothetical protein
MNNITHQYPAALYSAVSEIGYRSERFTGEVLHSGKDVPRGVHRRHLIARLRQAFASDGSRQRDRFVPIHRMHEAR